MSQSLQQIQPTGFYGASCTGNDGAWFLKIMQTGKSDELRANYDLHWSLSHGRPARPSGTVVVRPRSGATTASDVTITIVHGRVRVEGTEEPSKTSVTASGTLIVSLSNRPGFPTLTFVETGLTGAEAALGLNSPFTFDGKPLNLLLQHASILAGC